MGAIAADRDQPTTTTDDEQRAFSRVTVTRPQLGQSTAIPRLELTVEREDGRADGRVVVADGELCRIGSHASNDLVLRDPCTDLLAGTAFKTLARAELASGNGYQVDFGTFSGLVTNTAYRLAAEAARQQRMPVDAVAGGLDAASRQVAVRLR